MPQTSSRWRRPAFVGVGILLLVLALTGAALLVERSGLLAPTAQPPPPTVETLEEQLTRVASDVEEVRGLAFGDLPEPTYLPPDELADRASAFAEDYSDEDADTDRRVLAALGAMPPDVDLREMLSGVLAEQVAGFYDPETGEMVVSSTTEGERLGPTEEIILAHELEHALADQALGLPDTDGEDTPADATLAQSSLVEGDATLTMILYADEYLSAVDRLRMLGEERDAGAPAMQELENLPHVLRRSLLFPYEEGLTFVTSLHRSGGWDAVDAAYARLPASTLQILEPERYLAATGAGTDPRDPSPPGAGWERRDRLALGAADLLFLFEAPGDDRNRALEDAGIAARRWRGGEVVVWTRGPDSVVGVSLVGERGLCDAITTWYRRAFPDASREMIDRENDALTGFDGSAQDAVVRCTTGDEQTVRIGIAPDLEVATAVVR